MVHFGAYFIFLFYSAGIIIFYFEKDKCLRDQYGSYKFSSTVIFVLNQEKAISLYFR
jgi:hypothetical protein